MKNEVQRNMHQCVLADGEQAEIILSIGTVKIDSNGKASVDAGTFGFTRNLFEVESQSTSSGQLSNARYEPNKSDKMQQYLYTLFESQKCGHEVHAEIGEALKQYKAELGI